MGSCEKSTNNRSELNYYISNKRVHGWIRGVTSWKRDSILRRGSYSSCIVSAARISLMVSDPHGLSHGGYNY